VHKTKPSCILNHSTTKISISWRQKPYKLKTESYRSGFFRILYSFFLLETQGGNTHKHIQQQAWWNVQFCIEQVPNLTDMIQFIAANLLTHISAREFNKIQVCWTIGLILPSLNWPPAGRRGLPPPILPTKNSVNTRMTNNSLKKIFQWISGFNIIWMSMYNLGIKSNTQVCVVNMKHIWKGSDR